MPAALPTPAAVAQAPQAVLPEATAAWLLGSAVRPERMTAHSDADIAVRLARTLPPDARGSAMQALAERLGRTVELIDCDRARTVMQVQILPTGRLLFDRGPAAPALCGGRVCAGYPHIQRWRQPMRAALARRRAQAGRAAT